MSQYLSRFYCGNKEGLCNYTEPVKYEKVIDRQFDILLTEIVNQCPGEKGYCCDNSPANQKQMDERDMTEINMIANGKIFKKDEHGNFMPNQIPLVKVNRENGKMVSMNLCQCGGTPDEFNRCVNENCKDFKIPTRYEYCKIGNMTQKFGCYGDSQSNCEVGPANIKDEMVYSPNIKINNLAPDCYLNMCNKKTIDRTLDDTQNYEEEKQYYAYQNNVKSQYNQSLEDYLLLDGKKAEPAKPNSDTFSIQKMLHE